MLVNVIHCNINTSSRYGGTTEPCNRAPVEDIWSNFAIFIAKLTYLKPRASQIFPIWEIHQFRTRQNAPTLITSVTGCPTTTGRAERALSSRGSTVSGSTQCNGAARFQAVCRAIALPASKLSYVTDERYTTSFTNVSCCLFRSASLSSFLRLCRFCPRRPLHDCVLPPEDSG